jgi:hypothetical protein
MNERIAGSEAGQSTGRELAADTVENVIINLAIL